MKLIRKIEEILPGCFLVEPIVYGDDRGVFVKTMHEQTFSELGLFMNVKEEFFSVSSVGVIRGMHLQLPPAQYDKRVTCIRGDMLDVVLDLRKGDGYGKAASVVLSDKDYYQLYVPAGVAHGFLALKPDSILLYRTNSIHDSERDISIKWDSFGFDWKISNPSLSQRDRKAITFDKFVTPF